LIFSEALIPAVNLVGAKVRRYGGVYESTQGPWVFVGKEQR
jgi:hypothetical protein